MRRVDFPYLLALALLPALPPSATAVGLNLRWNACGAEGVSSLAFACNTNTGSDRLVGSYVAPNGITQLMGTEMILFATFSGTGVPSWWQMKNAGTCRQTALTLQTTPDPAWAVTLVVSHAKTVGTGA